MVGGEGWIAHNFLIRNILAQFSSLLKIYYFFILSLYKLFLLFFYFLNIFQCIIIYSVVQCCFKLEILEIFIFLPNQTNNSSNSYKENCKIVVNKRLPTIVGSWITNVFTFPKAISTMNDGLLWAEIDVGSLICNI